MPSVLVTGGAKRIGASIVRRFAAEGWHVLVHYNRSAEAAQALAAGLPGAETVQADLADVEAARMLVRSLANRLEDWRALICNASVFRADDVRSLDPAVNREAMQVNAVTPMVMAQEYLLSARSAAGRHVIQLTDQKLRNPNPDFFSYTMSKHAAAAGAQMLGMACHGADRVYSLAPGAILPSHDQSTEEASVSHRMNLLHRRTDAAEVAAAAYFLAQGTLSSGQALYVDSGQHLLAQQRDVLYLARGEDAL